MLLKKIKNKVYLCTKASESPRERGVFSEKFRWPWYNSMKKLNKKIYTAENKEEGVEWAEEPSITQQQRQESALLNAYESPGAHF